MTVIISRWGAIRGVFLSAAMLAALGFFSGCASVSTHSHERHGVPARQGPPEIIYIQEFEAPAEVFRVDRPEKEAEKLRTAEAARLAHNIVWRVRDHIGPSWSVTQFVVPPRGNYWLVTGKFIRVNQGSRALRMLLGFGAGGTKLETQVEVYDLSGKKPQLVMRFSTTGGSNAQPGAIANTNPWSAAFSGATLAFSGIRFDITRTSREITAALSQELALQGNLPDDRRPLRPKQLGKWP
ncbi:MAG: DUF4410 domain-containing protein [Chthoniobacterales bacterium]